MVHNRNSDSKHRQSDWDKIVRSRKTLNRDRSIFPVPSPFQLPVYGVQGSPASEKALRGYQHDQNMAQIQ